MPKHSHHLHARVRKMRISRGVRDLYALDLRIAKLLSAMSVCFWVNDLRALRAMLVVRQKVISSIRKDLEHDNYTTKPKAQPSEASVQSKVKGPPCMPNFC